MRNYIFESHFDCDIRMVFGWIKILCMRSEIRRRLTFGSRSFVYHSSKAASPLATLMTCLVFSKGADRGAIGHDLFVRANSLPRLYTLLPVGGEKLSDFFTFANRATNKRRKV